jgi:hypothetical protein
MSQKQKRVPRPKGELHKELNEQLSLLAHACQSFDNGLESIAKHIALSLRVLLHQHGQSQSLLEQLGLRSKRFMDTAFDLNPRNLLTECPLTIMQLSAGEAKYLSLCQAGGGPRGFRWVTFPEWWNNSIIKDDKGRFFNRRQLILNVANTDGGGHVDPTLDEDYMDLSRNNSLGWVITQGDIQKPFPPPVMACIRQIAHELLETLRVKADSVIVVPNAV